MLAMDHAMNMRRSTLTGLSMLILSAPLPALRYGWLAPKKLRRAVTTGRAAMWTGHQRKCIAPGMAALQFASIIVRSVGCPLYH